MSFSQGQVHISMKLLGIFSVGSDVTDQLLIRFLHSPDPGEKKWEYNETANQLFVYFKKAYDLVRWKESIVQYPHRVWGTHETS
jgi:hypothetical protein